VALRGNPLGDRGLGLFGRSVSGRIFLKEGLVALGLNCREPPNLTVLLGLESLGLGLLPLTLGLFALGLSRRGLPGRGLSGLETAVLGLNLTVDPRLMTMERSLSGLGM